MSDEYTLEHHLHHRWIGCRYQTEESELSEVLRNPEADQDLANCNQVTCQHLFDCGTNNIAILSPLINLLRELALYEERLKRIHDGIIAFGAAKDVAAIKVIAVKADLDAYQVPCDIENNCRLHNNDAFRTFCGWISKNLLTDGGQMSYHCNVTGLDNQEFEYFPVFDAEKKPSGLGSEQYASFHGWKVGPHAAKSTVLCSSLVPFPQSHDVWE